MKFGDTTSLLKPLTIKSLRFEGVGGQDVDDFRTFCLASGLKVS